MGRTELKPGEHGSISIKQTGPTTWRARTRLKLFTEEIVQVSRNASREDEARLKVQAAVAELLTAGRGSDELKPDSKVGLACRQWITEMRVRSSWPRPPMRTQTIDKYEYQLDRYAVPVLGNRRLNELTPALCQRLIEGQGSVRQAIPKTKAGERVITIPPFVVESLRELRPATATPAMPVFPSRRYRDDGTVLRCQAPSNCRRQLRAALAKVGMQGEAYPHLLRSTVATFVARKRGLLMQLRCSGTRSGPALRRGTT